MNWDKMKNNNISSLKFKWVKILAIFGILQPFILYLIWAIYHNKGTQ